MIYLLTQMILCLALAGVAGGAVGWLLHRTRAGRTDESLRETIVRQHHQLRHAETDVAMLTDDFDDLKQRSQTEIETLRAENRRLPALLQNLDKSQTLVRQLMQKHEAQLREAVQQNETLRARLAGHDEREAAFARARSELESARAQLQALRGGGVEARPVAADAAVSGPTSAPPSGAQRAAEASVADAGADGAPDEAPDAGADDSAGSGADDGADIDTDATVVIRASDLPAGIAARAGASEHGGPFAGSAADEAGGLPAASPVPDALADDDGVAPVGRSAPVVPAAPAAFAGLGARAGAPAGMGGGGFDDGLDGDFDAVDDDDPEAEDLDDLEDEDDFGDEDDDPLDESVELLFEPVDRHDDLQRIFGIGPVTERALNRLGITSYTQIAKLQDHEVEQIADALQIYPGRIERDDWVGNARRQLEDVLEEL